MKRIFTVLERFALLRAVVYVVLGIFTLLMPEKVFQITMYLFAGYFTVMGLLSIYESYRERNEVLFSDGGVISGVISLIGAVLLAVFGKELVSILPILLGIFVVLYGVFRILQALDARKLGYKFSIGFLIISILIFLVGIFMLINPFNSVIIVMQIFGGILIIMGIMEALSYFNFRNMNVQ